MEQKKKKKKIRARRVPVSSSWANSKGPYNINLWLGNICAAWRISQMCPSLKEHWKLWHQKKKVMHDIFAHTHRHTHPSPPSSPPPSTTPALMLSCGPGNVEAEWNKIWLVQRDARRDQSACLSVRVKVLTPSLRKVATWCCLDSSPLPSPPPQPTHPPETCLCSHPGILFTAPLHAIVLMIMGVDSCLMHRCHRRCLLIAAPLHLTGLKCICHTRSKNRPPPPSPNQPTPRISADRLMWFRKNIAVKKVCQTGAASWLQLMIRRHIALRALVSSSSLFFFPRRSRRCQS